MMLFSNRMLSPYVAPVRRGATRWVTCCVTPWGHTLSYCKNSWIQLTNLVEVEVGEMTYARIHLSWRQFSFLSSFCLTESCWAGRSWEGTLVVKCHPGCVRQLSGGETESGSSTGQRPPNKSAPDYKMTQTDLVSTHTCNHLWAVIETAQTYVPLLSWW